MDKMDTVTETDVTARDRPIIASMKPPLEDLEDLVGLIQRLETEFQAHQAGIAKITIPEEWRPRRQGLQDQQGGIGDLVFYMPSSQKMEPSPNGGHQSTRLLRIAPMPGMATRDFCQQAKDMERQSRLVRAGAPALQRDEEVEEEYWSSVHKHTSYLSGEQAHGLVDWDVKSANLTRLKNPLHALKETSPGAYVATALPRVSLGCWLATRGWRTEPMSLYLISILHQGSAPVTWYCVPPSHADEMECLIRRLFPTESRNCSNFAYHGRCAVPPSVLRDKGIPVHKVVQRAGEMVVLFPSAYHYSFDHGFNICESVNLATERWVEHGLRYRPCECSSKTLQFPMGQFVKRLRPDLYKRWTRRGSDCVNNSHMHSTEAEEALLSKLRSLQMFATDGLFSFTTTSGKEVKYDYRQNRVHVRDKLSAEDESAFQNWKKGFTYEADVYQHKEHKGMRILVDHSGKEVELVESPVGSGKLHKVKQTDHIHELLSKELVAKIGKEIRMIPVAYREGAATTQTDKAKDQIKKKSSKSKGHVYGHLFHEGLEVVVDPNTKKALIEPYGDLKQMLETFSLSDLIESGVLVFKRSVMLKVTKTFKEPNADFTCLGKSVEVEWFNFDDGEEKENVYVGVNSKEVLGELPGNLKATLKSGKDLDACKRDGTLKFKGEKKLLIEEEDSLAVAEHIYWHVDEKAEVRLDPRTCTFLGVEADDEGTADRLLRVADHDWKVMIKSGKLVKIGDMMRIKDGSEPISQSAKWLHVSCPKTGREACVSVVIKAARKLLKVSGPVVVDAWLTNPDLPNRDIMDMNKWMKHLDKGECLSVDEVAEINKLLHCPILCNMYWRFFFRENIVIRVCPDSFRVIDEDAYKLGVLREVPVDLLVSKGILTGKTVVKTLRETSKMRLLGCLQTSEGWHVSYVNNVVNVFNVSKQVAYRIKNTTPYDGNDLRWLAQVERRHLQSEVLLGTEYEVMQSGDGLELPRYDYDSDCSSDPELYLPTAKAPGMRKRKGAQKVKLEPFTEQIRTMLRAMTVEKQRLATQGGGDVPLYVNEELLERCNVVWRTFESSRPILAGLNIIEERVSSALA